MSSLALGSPTVTYSYQEDAKGSAFNKTFKNILAQGIYTGGGLSFVGNNITLAPYDALFPSTDNQLVAIHTSASIDLSGAQPAGAGLGAIISSTPYIAMTFIYANSTTVYPDYIFASASILTDSSYVILGMATFSGSVVTGFSYDNATYPPVYNSTSKQMIVKGTTDSSSSGTGSMVVSGGVGISKNLNVGGTLGVTGATTLTSTLHINDTTESSSKDTGSVILGGGLGVEKNVYIGGSEVVTGSIQSNNGNITSKVTSGESSLRAYLNDDLAYIYNNSAVCGLHSSSLGVIIAKDKSSGIISIGGNSVVGGNLSVTGNNTGNTSGDFEVSKYLRWKNFGSNHVIIDASNSTSPTGSAINSIDSQSPWSNTYPTLMGWNGINTYGVRVDRSRFSDKAATLAQGGIDGTPMTFNWSGQSGQPSWLWGSNDGSNHYVYNPSNFSVTNATHQTNPSYYEVANNAGTLGELYNTLSLVCNAANPSISINGAFTEGVPGVNVTIVSRASYLNSTTIQLRVAGWTGAHWISTDINITSAHTTAIGASLSW